MFWSFMAGCAWIGGDEHDTFSCELDPACGDTAITATTPPTDSGPDTPTDTGSTDTGTTDTQPPTDSGDTSDTDTRWPPTVSCTDYVGWGSDFDLADAPIQLTGVAGDKGLSHFGELHEATLIVGDGWADGELGVVYYLPTWGLTSGSLGERASAVISGTEADEHLGWDVETGDFDGDGVPQVAAGTYAPTGNGGRVFLFPSTLSGAVTTADADRAIVRESQGDQLGTRLRAGDVDADGYDDLLVLQLEGGQVHFFSGALLTSSKTDLDPGDAWLSMAGASNGLGVRHFDLGDLDGNDRPDAVFGDPSVGWANWGGTVSVFKDVGDLSGEQGMSNNPDLYLVSTGTDAQKATVHFGDYDGDGVSDLLNGAPEYQGDRGYAGVYLWGDHLGGTVYDFFEDAEYRFASSQVRNLGHDLVITDLDNDGPDDLVLGAFGASQAFVFRSGAFDGDYSVDTKGDMDSSFQGPDGSYAGVVIEAVGDIDLDCKGDLAIAGSGPGSETVWLLTSPDPPE